jgi:hypothetical protein
MARIFSLIVLLVLVTIAVFMYTANTSHPKAQKLFLPKDEEKDSSINLPKVADQFTVILAGSDEIYYYQGKFDVNTLTKTDYKAIRATLADKKKELGDNLVVIIKPHAKATYTNTVNMLDEMAIGDIKRYVLVDITKEEIDYLKTKE